MAFIDKKDPVVLNIKLTSKGRELLSEGILNYKYFAVGDSEIDYGFNIALNLSNPNDITNSPFYSHILRPADKNPDIISFIPRNLSGDPFNLITNVPSTPTVIQNTAPSLGFFTISTGKTTFITDTDHVKQPDAMVKISDVHGGKILKLYKAPTYLANVNEPTVGDLVLVKWSNPQGISTTGYTVDTTHPTPYLIYKIQGISSGSLASNNLIVQVDRELPNFSGSSSNVAGALIYYDYINYTGSTIFNEYSTDYVNEAVISFLQNCQCPSITFPFWNMSIIYTDDIAGVQASGRTFTQYKSKTYGGFVSYIQNQAPVIKKMGVIHYTNSSPSNTYGEELYQNTPTLTLPTVMWHKSLTNKMGLVLKAIGGVQVLTGITRSLNTTYYNLGDGLGNIVGKIFNDLQLFVIEDQELLFAMSYKANRSWTLPNYNIGINDNVIVGCAACTVEYDVIPVSPTTITGTNGSLTIKNISGNQGQLILEVFSGASKIFYQPIIASATTVINNLSAHSGYTVNMYDLGSPNCVVSKIINISAVTSSLYFTSLYSTSSGLNPNFKITQLSPVNLTIFLSDIGTYFATPKAAIKTYGSPIPSPSDAAFIPFTAGQVNFNNLNFGLQYTVYVMDYFNSSSGLIVSQNYVAVASPLNSAFAMSQGTDGGGKYINVSNYITTIVPSVNPVVGILEASIYPLNSVAQNWMTVTGSPAKLYSGGIGNFNVSIRERQGGIIMYTVTNPITII